MHLSYGLLMFVIKGNFCFLSELFLISYNSFFYVLKKSTGMGVRELTAALSLTCVTLNIPVDLSRSQSLYF